MSIEFFEGVVAVGRAEMADLLARYWRGELEYTYDTTTE